jgi:fluoroacetyl-CoA thioesterase
MDRNEERMKEIPIGAKGDFALVVAPEHLANRFKDTTLPAVLATPVMIMVMENAALNAIKPYLDPGESAVGTRIDIHHVAPTPAGLSVVGEAEVTGVDGRRITFTVRAADNAEEIGAGTHERVIVDLARPAKRLDAKRTR